MALLVGAAACGSPPAHDARPAARPVVFDGARLITGDGTPAIERATLVVDSGRVVAVGAQGQVTIPEAATRVDVTGKTIMPAMIDAHAHIGYMRNLTSGPQNYTRDNIVDHLQRYAYFGVAAGQAMGSDFTDLPYQLRDESAAGRIPDAARFLTAGRGLAPPDEVRPDNMRHSAYAITTEAEARAAVGELAGARRRHREDVGRRSRRRRPQAHPGSLRGDHRRGPPTRHARRWCMPPRSTMRKPCCGPASTASATPSRTWTTSCSALVKARPQVFFMLALGGPRRVVSAAWLDPVHPLVAETVSPEQIARLQQRLARQTPDERERARAAWERMAAGIARLSAAGARIAVGTDGGGQLGDQFVGWTVHTEVENMVAAGMTPAQVLVAATSAGAAVLGLDDLGAVAPGKSADFVVLDANPLDDITNTRRIAQVYLRGTAVDRARLRAQWTGAGATQ